jgi:hypothetical protein
MAMIRIRECKFTKPSASLPKSSSRITLKSIPSKKVNVKYTMTAPIKAATALFNLSVIIRIITPIKHVKAIIILRTILPSSSNMIYETTRIYS